MRLTLASNLRSLIPCIVELFLYKIYRAEHILKYKVQSSFQALYESVVNTYFPITRYTHHNLQVLHIINKLTITTKVCRTSFNLLLKTSESHTEFNLTHFLQSTINIYHARHITHIVVQEICKCVVRLQIIIPRSVYHDTVSVIYASLMILGILYISHSPRSAKNSVAALLSDTSHHIQKRVYKVDSTFVTVYIN